MELEDFTHDLKGNELSFDGNHAIKKCSQPLPFTKEHIDEMRKCKEDIFYFAENYYHILNLDEGMQKVKLREYQKEMLGMFDKNRFSIILASRQSGKCTQFCTKVRIRNKKTGEISEVEIGSLTK